MLGRILQQSNVVGVNDPPATSTQPKCNLFGSFSYIVQFILGVLSFMVLIYKRTRESPKRPWKIWFFDVSKQIISASTIHMLNLFFAIFLSINIEATADECVWYFLNLFVDTTLGVFICFALLFLVDKVAKKKNIRELHTGLYFDKIEKNGKIITKLNPVMYFCQLGIWILIVVISKLFLLGFSSLLTKILEIIGNFILKPFKTDEKLELVMVMVIFPLIFNICQFWVLDNILKLPPQETKEVMETSPEYAEDLIAQIELNNQNNHQVIPPIEMDNISRKSNISNTQISNLNVNIYVNSGEKPEKVEPNKLDNEEKLDTSSGYITNNSDNN